MMAPSQPIVTSGDDDDSNRSVEMDHHPEATDDPLFDATADAHDASYVDRHLRSGTGGTTATSTTTDAVLSCPCCFQIVCMDCQRHDTYQHIYRAMFVMGITVSWDRPLEYDEASQSLIAKQTEGSMVPSSVSSVAETVGTVIPKEEMRSNRKDSTQDEESTPEEAYYTVRCANCETVVAALNMGDEVYHFSGCLASA